MDMDHGPWTMTVRPWAMGACDMLCSKKIGFNDAVIAPTMF